MDYKEALFQVVKASREETDTEDSPALTKKIIEILNKLDDQEYAIKIIGAMGKSAMCEMCAEGGATCFFDFLEKKALEGLKAKKELKETQEELRKYKPSEGAHGQM